MTEENHHIPKRNILALSSSRVGAGGYLEDALSSIREITGNAKLKVAFVPFASVERSYNEYLEMVAAGLSALDLDIFIAQDRNSIDKSDAIMVGGGNTFKLLHDLYQKKFIDIIRDKVDNGVPYIGWSAGSNILSPTICTTNDMPVIQPASFNALGLFPFQINPHYYNLKPEGFNGETRDQRLAEFIILNPGIPVVGLPEGTALRLTNGQLQLSGTASAVLFIDGEKKDVSAGDDLSFLL